MCVRVHVCMCVCVCACVCTYVVYRVEHVMCSLWSSQEKVIEDEVKVDPKYHRHFIQRRGQVRGGTVAISVITHLCV